MARTSWASSVVQRIQLFGPVTFFNTPDGVPTASKIVGNLRRRAAFSAQQQDLRPSRNTVLRLARAKFLLQNGDVFDL
jgi:hypothetical protein